MYEGTGHDPARVSDTTTEEYFANAELFAHRPTNSAMDLSKLIVEVSPRAITARRSPPTGRNGFLILEDWPYIC